MQNGSFEGDELVAVNMSVWESIEALGEYVHRSDHTAVLRRKREWFQGYGSAYLALWWVPAGHIPTIDEALERLSWLEHQVVGNAEVGNTAAWRSSAIRPMPAAIIRRGPEPARLRPSISIEPRRSGGASR